MDQASAETPLRDNREEFEKVVRPEATAVVGSELPKWAAKSTRRKSHSSRMEYNSSIFRGQAMTNVFEVVDEAGAVRNYVAKFMRREADKLVVDYRGLQVRFAISHIRDWCAVE